MKIECVCIPEVGDRVRTDDGGFGMIVDAPYGGDSVRYKVRIGHGGGPTRDAYLLPHEFELVERPKDMRRGDR